MELTPEDIQDALDADAAKQKRTGSYVILRVDGQLVKRVCRTTTALVGGFSSPRRMTATRKSTWLGGKATENPRYINNVEEEVVAYLQVN